MFGFSFLSDKEHHGIKINRILVINGYFLWKAFWPNFCYYYCIIYKAFSLISLKSNIISAQIPTVHCLMQALNDPIWLWRWKNKKDFELDNCKSSYVCETLWNSHKILILNLWIPGARVMWQINPNIFVLIPCSWCFIILNSL